MIEFEFDEQKSEINFKKHGIDFVDAQKIWEDPDVMEIPARVKDEPRFLVIGINREKHWSAVVTYRHDKIRIISVRRSSPKEVELYESS